MIPILSLNSRDEVTVQRLIAGVLQDEFHLTQENEPDLYRELFRLSAALLDTRHRMWVAFSENGLAGTIAFECLNDEVGLLTRMYIDPSQRGTGLSLRLWDVVLRAARELRCKVIYLTTHPDMKAAQAFYLKVGFREATEVPKEVRGYAKSVYFRYDIQEDSVGE